MIDVAIVVCTYNPNQTTFERVIESISKLSIPENYSVEYCIVDNNSNISIDEILFVQDFLKKFSNAKVIIEKKQGLSFARMAGVKTTTAPVIVFFDDDNIPDVSFIENLKKLIQDYPQVAVWGPGIVKVEFTQKVDNWINSYKWMFQERNNINVEFGNEHHWTTYYPPGTGQVVKRNILELYNQLLDKNILTITDRKGKSLDSGGDAQIVYMAVKNGYHAGVSPDLILTHLIDKKRTDTSYAKRLLFSIMYSGAVANVEIFPEQKDYYYSYIKSSKTIILKLVKIIGSSIRDKSVINFNMNSAFYLGELAGSYRVTKGKLPTWLSIFIKVLKLK